ncbi:MAG: hypothetical protein SF052_16015 [Bacteroidia bacterium]|nr:hypothetical protein [Bacteroidia bacterium]
MKKLALFTTVCLAFVCTSCLNIVEEIFLKKDGSGSYTVSVDMNEMMNMMQGLMTQEQMGENDMFSQMDSTIQETLVQLRQVDGLSNVSHKAEGYKFSISYDFTSVEALNNATKNGSVTPGMDFNSSSSDNFTWSKGLFERANPPLGDLMEDEEFAANFEMAKMFMSGASYKTIYHLPGKVSKMENEKARLSPDKKTVTLDVQLVEVLEGKSFLGNKVKFKGK